MSHSIADFSRRPDGADWKTARSRVKSRIIALAGATALAAGLAGCGQTIGNPFGGDSGQAEPPPAAPQAAAPGSTLGTGPVRVGLLLPLTQGGAPSAVGTSLKNAAELAISDTGGTAVTLLVKDTGGSAGGARDGAQAAIREGAQMIIGPLFAGSVRAAGSVARGAGKPVIAFSTDTSVAARQVYLLSFLVENEVARVVEYAASKGKRSIAVLAPQTSYGSVAAGAVQQAAAARGMRIAVLERYSGSPSAAAQRIGAAAGTFDTLFVPDQAQNMAGLSSLLISAGVDPNKVLVMGTGLWNDARTMNLPLLQGAVFAAPENAGFNAFADRYRSKFNSDPTRIATLAYDAVTLAVALAGQQSANKFPESILTNASGFNGADGLFRFRSDGTNQRGLAVQQIRRGTTSTVSGAPRSFSGRSGT
ncbi:MAG: penicillin-binding protein activator [Beijerinckiaceae bacterium]